MCDLSIYILVSLSSCAGHEDEVFEKIKTQPVRVTEYNENFDTKRLTQRIFQVPIM